MKKKDMNRNLLIGISSAVVILVLILVLTRSNDPEQQEQMDKLLVPTASADMYESSNRLEVNKGSATVNRADGTEEEITDETDVAVGDTIVVSEDGKATLYWFDHSISRLAAGTELVIDEASYNPENITEADVGFEVISGEVWSKVQAIVDEDSEFLSYSGKVVAGVRGSVFNLKVDGDTVEVDSIAHAIEVTDEFYTSGERGVFNKETGENIEWGEIGEEQLRRDWFKDNSILDEKARRTQMIKMMKKLQNTLGTLPGDADFETRLDQFEAHLNTIQDPREKARLKAKMVGLLRALDVLPDHEHYKFKLLLQAKLIEWETDEKKIAFLNMMRIERHLYDLYDWAVKGNLSPEQVQKYLESLRSVIGNPVEFFEANPDLIDLVEKIIEELEKSLPGFGDKEGARWLRDIGALDDDSEETTPKASFTAPARTQTPPPAIETPEEIDEQAPFRKGESDV